MRGYRFLSCSRQIIPATSSLQYPILHKEPRSKVFCYFIRLSRISQKYQSILIMEGGETLGSPTSPRTISELRALLPSDSELATTSGAPSRAPSHSFGHPHRVPSPPQILSPTGAADKPTAYGYYDQSDQPPTTSQTLAQTVLNPSRKILSEAPRVELPSSSSGHQVKHPRSSSYSRHRRSTKAQHPPTVPESITELRDLLEENSVYANTEELRPEPIHVPPFAPGVSSSLQSGARSFLSDRSPMTSPSTVLPSSFSQRPQRSRGYTPSPIKTSPGRSPASPISPTGLLHHNPILTSPMTTSGAWIPHAPSQTSSLPQKATAQNLLCSKQIEGAVVRAPSPGTNNGGSEYSVTKELISNIKRKGIEGYEITPQERYDEQIKLKLLAAQNTNRYVAELVSPSQLQEPDIPASRLDEVDPNLEPVEAGGVRYLDIFSQWNRPLSEMSEGTRIKYSFEQQAIVLNARHQEAVKAIYLDQTLNEEEKRRLVADREQEFERNIKRIQEVTGYKVPISHNVSQCRNYAKLTLAGIGFGR